MEHVHNLQVEIQCKLSQGAHFTARSYGATGPGMPGLRPYLCAKTTPQQITRARYADDP